MDSLYWQATFTSALKVRQKWATEQALGETILVALIEFHGRLRLLASSSDRACPEVFGVLLDFPGALRQLRGKHLRGMENLMAALSGCIARFQTLHAELAELHAGSWQRFAQSASKLPASKATEPMVGRVRIELTHAQSRPGLQPGVALQLRPPSRKMVPGVRFELTIFRL